MVEYGNADHPTGPLYYSVLIRGLDLTETFQQLREALTDSRFQWDVDDLMAQVKNGCLELKNLNPTKASILVSRIKYFPVEVSWKQEAYGASS